MFMNKLTREKRAQVLQMMVEGLSLRAITRLTDISRTTLLKLLADAGEAFSEYQDRTLVNLNCKRVQVDEAWAFCYAKQRNVAHAKAAPIGAGDIWTWVGLDADSKLAVSWYVGNRDGEAGHQNRISVHESSCCRAFSLTATKIKLDHYQKTPSPE
jgi:hypothetical protein